LKHYYIRRAEIEDLSEINAIYNEAVLYTTATFDTDPKTLDYHRQWFAAHGPKNPILVAKREGSVIGWGSLNPYSDRAAYESTVELSLYIHASHRGQGIGKALMSHLLAAGQEAGVHAVLSRITEGNATSLRLHEEFGFWTVGTMKEVGVKFGRLLDVHLLEKIL
jgi:L-amino acid N-acyltransferase